MAVLVFPVFAEKLAMPGLTMPTAAASGFGGHHVAYTDNVFSLLVNPAAIMRTNQNSIFSVSASVFSPQFTFGLIDPAMKMIKGNTDALKDMTQTLSDKEGRVVLGLSLNEFPLSIASVSNGFGFGLWNRTYANIIIDGTRVITEVYEDIMLPIGLAFKIFDFGSMTLDAGVTIKPFARAMGFANEEITNLFGSGATDDFIKRLNVPVIVGGGLDAGLMYRWGGLSAGLAFNDIFSLGCVVHNIAGTDNNEYYVPFTMNFGLAYDLKLLGFLGITVAADWHDVFNIFNQNNYLGSRNFVLDFSVGAQLSLFNFLYVRVGVNEMLPAAGVGVHLGMVKIDLAYYGREFGYEPGQYSTAVLELSVSIRPEAKKADWPWARRSIVGLITGGD
jgi:hypothetical protein